MSSPRKFSISSLICIISGDECVGIIPGSPGALAIAPEWWSYVSFTRVRLGASSQVPPQLGKIG